MLELPARVTLSRPAIVCCLGAEPAAGGWLDEPVLLAKQVGPVLPCNYPDVGVRKED